jgi:hypothetical protein
MLTIHIAIKAPFSDLTYLEASEAKPLMPPETFIISPKAPNTNRNKIMYKLSSLETDFTKCSIAEIIPEIKFPFDKKTPPANRPISSDGMIRFVKAASKITIIGINIETNPKFNVITPFKYNVHIITLKDKIYNC